VPPAPPLTLPVPAPAPRRLQNLLGGFSLFLLRERPPEAFVRSFDQLLVLLAVNAAVWIGLQWWQHADPDKALGLAAFYRLGCYVLIVLFGCALVARLNSREADTRSLLIPLLSAAPFVQVLFRLVPPLVGRSESLGRVAIAAGMLYLGLLSVRVLWAAYGRMRLGAGLTAVLLILATPVALDAMKLDTRLPLAPGLPVASTASDAGSDDDTVEPLLYSQPERLAAAMARMDSRRREGGAVYFVGFAGDGDHAIFRREALAAEHAISGHFGEQGRALNLINDSDDRDSYPIASLTGLSQALTLLAGRMDRANDVVVLTLTSHGSQDGLDVKNGAVPLLDLEPDDLRQAFDDAGIRWRVVIVSACYSGVFVDSLKSDTSLVITAADDSNTSFGCDDHRELTYFGEAFFKDALPASDSLEQAFGRAASLISTRETQKGLRHSNPQMFVGSLMKAKLATLEARAHPAGAHGLTASGGR
jgi:hypothetical protein